MPSPIKTIIAIVAYYCCTSLPLTSGFLTNHNHQTTNSFTTTTSSPTLTCSSSSITSSSSIGRSNSYPPVARSRASTGWTTNINAIASHRKSSKLWLEFPNFFNFNPFGGNNGNNDDEDDKTTKMGESSDGEGAIEADGEYVASTEIFHIPAKKNQSWRPPPLPSTLLHGRTKHTHSQHMARRPNRLRRNRPLLHGPNRCTHHHLYRGEYDGGTVGKCPVDGLFDAGVGYCEWYVGSVG